MIKTHEITVPTSLQDIKLDDLINFSKVDENDYTQLMYKAFDLFCGIPKELLRSIPMYDAEKIYTKVMEAFSAEVPERLTFELNGITYGRIPNLEDISLGEHIDLDNAITPLFEGEIKHETAFDFMRVLYRPINQQSEELYSIVDYDKHYLEQTPSRIFKDAPSDVYVSGRAFFLNLRSELLTSTRKYLEEAQEVMIARELYTTESTDGLAPLIALVKGMSTNGTKQRINPFSDVLPSWQKMQTKQNLSDKNAHQLEEHEQ